VCVCLRVRVWLCDFVSINYVVLFGQLLRWCKNLQAFCFSLHLLHPFCIFDVFLLSFDGNKYEYEYIYEITVSNTIECIFSLVSPIFML